MTTQITVPVSAGIDVGAETLVLVIRQHGVSLKAQTFANTEAQQRRLLKRLSRFPGITVCLEATGVYYLDLALTLADAGMRLMVLNRKAALNEAKVLLRNSKTDAVDADTLAQYAERMPYRPWARPSNEALALRATSPPHQHAHAQPGSGQESTARAQPQPADPESGPARRDACDRPTGKAHRPSDRGSQHLHPGASGARAPVHLAAHGQGHR